MVETEQSIKKGISHYLTFGAKSVEPELLEQLLFGRRETVNLLQNYVQQIATARQNQQLIIIGPRGSGKTHILRVLFHRIGKLVTEKKLIVAYFAEEEYGIDSYLDFLIRIINAFKRWYETDAASLEERLDVLRETPPARQETLAEQIITEFVGDLPLLVLTENFDDTLKAIGIKGQNQLRAFLYRHNRISIFATSQALIPDLKKEDKPFYNFFIPIFLEKLNYEDSLALLQQLAAIEGKPELIEHLNNNGKAQIRAIYELVKGNHRLLITFFEFLKADSLASLSTLFIKTMNDLKPYFETFIRYLPPQQQKIIHYLAINRIPKKGTDIAKHCFINDKSISKQMSELQRRRLVDVLPDPESKRDKLYDIAEPLLRISIEIGEHKEGITSLFIDFLALYYSLDELRAQKNTYFNLLGTIVDKEKLRQLQYEFEARIVAIKKKQKLNVEKSKNDQIIFKLLIRKKFAQVLKFSEAYGIGDSLLTLFCMSIAYLNTNQPEKGIKYLNDFYENKGKLPRKKIGVNEDIIIDPDYIYIYTILDLTYNLPETEKTIIFSNLLKLEYHLTIKILARLDYLNFSLFNSIYDKNSQLINKPEFLEMLKKAIINTLSYSTKETIGHYQQIVINTFNSPPEFETILLYLDTYNKYKFQKNKSVLNQLPKEQREFFVREILQQKKAE